MPSEQHLIGGGATVTILSPLVLAAMLLTILCMFTLPRKYVIVPFLLCIFLVPLGQQIVLGGVHWLVVRVLVMSGLLRAAMWKVTGKADQIERFNGIDRAFMLCMCCQVIGVVVQFMDSQAVINQAGFVIDYIGAYLLVRTLIRDRADCYIVLKCMAVLTLVLGALMVREQLTMQNVFGLLGGVGVAPAIREGKIRSQGVFQHALTAGCFAASLLPLFILLWSSGKAKLVAALGVAGSTIMTTCSQSSTPLLGYAAAVLGLLLWPARREMRMIRWGIVMSLLGLAFTMKAPVWFVIAHIDLTGGSSGYHRALLIDQFIRHFADWWLIGTKDAGSWGYDVWDTQNQYVDIGQTGGLMGLLAFIVMIYRVYARLGGARKCVAGQSAEWSVWCLGAAIFAHSVNFFGVNYFDQSKIGWFIVLAMVPAITDPILASRKEAPPSPVSACGSEELVTSSFPSTDHKRMHSAVEHSGVYGYTE